MKRALSLLLGLGLWGCDDPLKPVELVDEPRVLGARVEVTDEPERAAPAPGENATVRFLLATPERAPSLGFALAACPAVVRNGARSACDGEPFAAVVSNDGDAAEAALSFDVPTSLDPAGRVAVLGILCPHGSPNRDGTACDGAAPGTPVQLELELARDGDVNQNPELQPDSLSFDDQPWPELAAPSGDCAGAGFVEAAAGSKHTLRVAVDESDRDPLPRKSDLDPERESLQLSEFVSAGDLTRAFQTIAWNSSELTRSVEWTAPNEAGLVRVWLVLRDFRGGGAFVERAVCVR